MFYKRYHTTLLSSLVLMLFTSFSFAMNDDSTRKKESSRKKNRPPQQIIDPINYVDISQLKCGDFVLELKSRSHGSYLLKKIVGFTEKGEVLISFGKPKLDKMLCFNEDIGERNSAGPLKNLQVGTKLKHASDRYSEYPIVGFLNDGTPVYTKPGFTDFGHLINNEKPVYLLLSSSNFYLEDGECGGFQVGANVAYKGQIECIEGFYFDGTVHLKFCDFHVPVSEISPILTVRPNSEKDEK